MMATSVRNATALHEAIVSVAIDAENARPSSTNKLYLPRQAKWRTWCSEQEFDDGSTVYESKLLLYIKTVVVPNGNQSNVEGKKATPLSKEGVEAHLKAVIDLYKRQQTLGTNRHPHPRGSALNAYVDTLKRTDYKRKRDLYEDRQQGSIKDGLQREDFAMVNKILLSQPGNKSLRTRLDLALACAMVARGENIRKLQLADLFPLELEAEGPQDCIAMIALMGEGKTNIHNRHEYGAIMRHLDPVLCPIGATAIYLFSRWHIEGEPFPNFSERRNWYDIHVVKGSDRTKPITYRSQARCYKETFKNCGILSYKVTHIGRPAGARMIEAKGGEEAEIRKAGRWTADKMQGCYLSTLPRKAMRILAGFDKNGGSFWLRRGVMSPPDALLQQVFPDTDAWLKRIDDGEVPEPDLAAQGFLRLLRFLRVVLLQDAVVLRNEFPQLPVWQHEMFRSQIFEKFASDLTTAMQAAKNPISVQLKQVVPEIANQIALGFNSVDAKLNNLRVFVQQENEDIRACVERLARRRIVVNVTEMDSDPVSSRQSRDRQATGRNTPDFALAETLPLGVYQTATAQEPPNYKLSRSLHSIGDVWNEYDTGIDGGPSVRYLDEHWGSRWRQEETESRFYRRRRAIYDAVRAKSVHLQVSCQHAAQVLDDERLRAKKTLTQFVASLKK